MKLILAILILALPVVRAPADPPSVVPDADTHRAITAGLGAAAYQVQDLEIPLDPVAPFTVKVDLGGQVLHLDLAPSSIRALGFAVRTSAADGSLRTIAPPPPRTVRGFVRETGAPVGGALLPAGLRVLVLAEDGAWSIGPLADIRPAPRTRHTVVHALDEIGLLGTCPGGLTPPGVLAPAVPNPRPGPRGLVSVVEFHAEADFELFVRNGSSIENTVADVEAVMQAVNIIYERDIDATNALLGVLVRTSAAEDPYYGVTDSGTLLSEFRTWWNQNQAGTPRDLVHLFTGKELDGSTIGLAYVGVVCNSPSFSYGLSETRFSLTMARRAGVTAHEIGHNFSASHCNGNEPCHIMCATINGCNGLGLPNFGPASIASITAHIDSAGCLSDGEGQPLFLPIADNFPLTTFDSRVWASIDGPVITDEINDEPSPPYAALLSASSTLATDLIDLSVPLERPVTVRFWARAISIEPGENLEVSYTREGQSRVVFAVVTPPPGSVETVGPVRLLLPAAALGTHTSIGFRSTGDSGSDQWFIDDVRIEQAPAPASTLFDDFPGSVLDQWTWPLAVGSVVNAGSPNPPSPPFVLNLDATDRVDSRAIAVGSVPASDDIWLVFDLQSNNVEPSKSFRARYFNSAGQWTTVWQHAPRSAERSAFKVIAIPLPPDAEHDLLAVRLEAQGADGTDDWFIDDVLVSRAPAHRLPLSDDFDDPDELISPTNWYPIDGAVINQGAVGEPSGDRSVNLDNQDRLTSRPINLSTVSADNRLVARFWLQHNGVDPGQMFSLDYRSITGTWTNAWAYASPSSDRVTPGFLVIPLPPEALHADAQVRFRVDGADGSDDWFVDSLTLGLEAAPALPIVDDFPTTVLDPLIWADDDSVAVNTGALDEPSPPYSMNLDRAEFAITQPVLATSPADGVVARFWLQHNGVEPGKNFIVEYTNAAGSWRTGEVFASTAADRVTYGVVHVPFGTDAAHAALQTRLRVNGADGSDDWFIDDLEIFAFEALGAPVRDGFLTQRLDPVRWRPVGGTPAINLGALNPPSPPYVLNLDSAEGLETAPIDASAIGQRPTLRFWEQHNGVEPGEALVLEWRHAPGAWQHLATLVSESSSRSAGLVRQFDLPLSVSQDRLTLRLSVTGTEPNDDWFIDDFAIENKSSLTVPFAEDFELIQSEGVRNWSVLDGLVTTFGANEPSGEFSLRLGEAGRAELLPIDLTSHTEPLFARCWVQYAGPSGGFRTVVLQYADASGIDRVLGVVRSSDTTAGAFNMFEFELPADARHGDFTLELVTNISGGGTFFYIDDVQIDGERLAVDCPPDLNGDGYLDFFDIQVFLNAFTARDELADLNGDGLWDFFDVQAYLNLFGAGCP